MHARFVYACSTRAQLPLLELPEVAVAGRSNCGKSSLINSLTGHNKLARASTTPGRTQQMIFFWVKLAASTPPFHLVDFPGYGFARANRRTRSQWNELVTHYIETRSQLKLMLVLNDIRRDPQKEERDLLVWCRQKKITPLVVLTKADKLGKSRRKGVAEQTRAALGLADIPAIVSTRDQMTIDNLRQRLRQQLEQLTELRE